jgi:competence protein ComEA
MTNRIGRFVGVTIAEVALLTGSAAGQSFPDGPGKDVFLAVCSSCHDPAHVIGKRWDKTQWTAKVLEMLQEEPDVTQANREAIIEYLAKNFGPAAKTN